MTIPAADAASALKDAEAAAVRAASARGYQQASLYLILWGVIWAAASVASQVSLPAGMIAWDIGVVLGVGGSIALGARQGRADRRGGALKSLTIALAIGGFGACAGAVVPSLGFAQYGALACLMVGAVYMAMGANGGGFRLSAVGAAMMAATLIGWLFARDHFFLWMAAAGGGGLILGGLWFRRV